LLYPPPPSKMYCYSTTFHILLSPSSNSKSCMLPCPYCQLKQLLLSSFSHTEVRSGILPLLVIICRWNSRLKNIIVFLTNCGACSVPQGYLQILWLIMSPRVKNHLISSMLVQKKPDIFVL